MEKYTIDIYLVDEVGFETNSTLCDITHLQLMELYALTSALKFPTKKILIHSKDLKRPKLCIEEYIILQAVVLTIEGLKQS